MVPLLLFPHFTFADGEPHKADLIGDWPMFGNGAAHTSYFPGRLGDVKFALKWSRNVGAGKVYAVVADSNRVYVTAQGYYNQQFSTVRALDALDGRLLWKHDFFQEDSITAPTYHGGSIYLQHVKSSGSRMLSLNAVTGATNWSVPFQVNNTEFGPVVADEMLWTARWSGVSGLAGYFTSGGVERFFVPVRIGSHGASEWTPAYYNNKVYTWVNGYFTEYDSQTGHTNWSLTLGDSSEFQGGMYRSVAIADGRAYCTTTDNVFSIDLAQRQVAWSLGTGFQCAGTPAIANGVVYSIANGRIIALSTNGAYLGDFLAPDWNTSPPGRFAGPIIVTDDVLIASTTPGNVFVFNRTNFTAHHQRIDNASRFALANNVLYISASSNVMAFSAEALWKFTVKATGVPYDFPEPYPLGTNYAFTNVLITETIESPLVVQFKTRHRLLGWTGQGSVPAAGTSNTVSFVITNDSELTWHWQTEHWLDVETDLMGGGSVNLQDSWQIDHESIMLTATPSNYYHFAYWDGDVSSTSNVIMLSMTRPLRVVAHFAHNRVTNGVAESWLASNGLEISDEAALADSDGDGMANWQEYHAGTLPRDPASTFRLAASAITLPLNPTQFRVDWPSGPGRRYNLWGTTNLAAGFSIVRSNIGGVQAIQFPVLSPKGFYFLEAQQTP